MFKAILTGHTQGLGAAVAEELMARGIAVLGLARGRLEQTRFPNLLSQATVDLSDSAALARWLSEGQLADFCAGADAVLLINNAGVVQPVGALSDQDPLAVARAITLNVAAPLALAAALATRTSALRILHISSGAGRNAYPGWSVYCATKAALDHHARAVALDGQAGVRICSLAPGVIDTGMQAQIRNTPATSFPMRERFVALHRDGQLEAPDAVARKLLNYLLADSFGSKPVDDLRS